MEAICLDVYVKLFGELGCRDLFNCMMVCRGWNFLIKKTALRLTKKVARNEFTLNTRLPPIERLDNLLKWFKLKSIIHRHIACTYKCTLECDKWEMEHSNIATERRGQLVHRINTMATHMCMLNCIIVKRAIQIPGTKVVLLTNASNGGDTVDKILSMFTGADRDLTSLIEIENGIYVIIFCNRSIVVIGTHSNIDRIFMESMIRLEHKLGFGNSPIDLLAIVGTLYTPIGREKLRQFLDFLADYMPDVITYGNSNDVWRSEYELDCILYKTAVAKGVDITEMKVYHSPNISHIHQQKRQKFNMDNQGERTNNVGFTKPLETEKWIPKIKPGRNVCEYVELLALARLSECDTTLNERIDQCYNSGIGTYGDNFVIYKEWDNHFQ